MKRSPSHWFLEYLSPDLIQQLGIKDIIYSGETKYQRVEIIDTFSFGRCLILDGKIQSSEGDEFIYHEALVHPPMLLHPYPQTVFIAGGGEGATLREVLSHNTVKKVVMVDRDEEVVKLCQQFLPSWHEHAYQDSRVKLLFGDAREYMEQTQNKFDIIIMDITDPVEGGPSYLLYTQEFYGLAKGRLMPQGIISVQAGPSRLPVLQTFLSIIYTLKEIFPFVIPYQTEVPSFGGNWGFVLASQSPLPSLTPEEVDQRLSLRLDRPLRFYDGITHQNLFSPPKYLRQELEKGGKVIRDKEPHFSF